jgi:hypothetical protein
MKDNIIMNNHLLLAYILITSLLYHVYALCNASFPYSYAAGCYQQCPWNDTVVTYLQDGTTSCSTSILQII